MEVDTVRMSSKGQIVIPQGIREASGMEEGTILAVTGQEDMIVLKKVDVPSRADILKRINAFADASRRSLKRKGITEKGVIKKASRKHDTGA